ncbi:MAG TPA: M56 family metallopeptidase [Thermoanaerobaculia bacterium]|nr:M56 family metallopeptidase [Thermoanaerobaculia bacterium]
MSAMELLTAPLAQAIGWALLHLLWQAAIVAGILAATLALLSRHSANARYAVSCSALVLVFALFIGTAYRSYERSDRLQPVDGGLKPAATSVEEELVPVTKVPVLIAVAATTTWRERAMELVASAQRSLPAIVAIWLAGVIVLSSRLLVSWARARRLARHGAEDASEHWQRVAARLSSALGLRRAVRLVESAAVEVPSVIGSLRPVILIPASALTGMTPEQIEMVLAHELAHIRRHDFFVNLLQAMVETLMFYHPAVWWMSRRVRIEREHCCDDLAVAVCGNPIQYARALTRLEELRAHAPALTVAANGGSLIERIRRLVAERAESTGSSSRWAAAVAMLSVVVIALAVPSLPALADRDDEKKKQKPAATKVEVVEPKSEADADDEEDLVVIDDDLDIDIDVSAMPPIAVVPMFAATPMPAPAPTPAIAGIPTPRPARAPRAIAVPNLSAIAAVTPAPPAPPAMAAMHAGYWGDDDENDESEKRDRKKFGTGGRLTVDELIQLRAVGVTPQYVEQMKAVFPDLTLGEVTSLRALNVSPEYIKSMRDAGVDVKTPRQAQQLRALNVAPEWVKKLAAAGYANLSVRELSRLAAVGIDEDFIREMSKYRDRN